MGRAQWFREYSAAAGGVRVCVLRGYAEAGGAEELLAKYGLTPKDIDQMVRGAVRSKDS